MNDFIKYYRLDRGRFMGASSMLMGYSALERLITFTNERGIVLEKELSRVSKLTPEAYEAAREVATATVSYVDALPGFAFAALAGICAIRAIYHTNTNSQG